MIKADPELGTFYNILNKLFFTFQLPELPVQWSGRMTRAAGIYYAHKAYIALSRPLLKSRPPALLTTLLHEMIHVWCHRVCQLPQEAHGRHFRSQMQLVNAQLAAPNCWNELCSHFPKLLAGCPPEPLQITLRHQFETQALARYRASCPVCGHSRLYHRQDLRLACGLCCRRSGQGWQEAYRLVWVKLATAGS